MKNDYSKYLHKVVRIKKPLFEDDYLDEGMMARVKAIREKEGGEVEIVFDLSEFYSFNVSKEHADYWDKDHKATLTASKAGYYPKNHMDTCYLMNTDNFDNYMEIIENELDTPALMLETLKMAYCFALDHSIEGETGNRLTAEEQKELVRRLFYYWGVK